MFVVESVNYQRKQKNTLLDSKRIRNMERKKIIGYARVSSERQSLAIQISQLKEYADRMGYEIEIFSEVRSAKYTREYVDVWKLGKLKEAILRAKELSTPIVVTYLDRISRNVNVGMWVWKECEAISLYTPAKNNSEVEEYFRKAEEDNIYRSTKTKNALESRLKAKIHDFVEEYSESNKETFYKEGSAEYVVEIFCAAWMEDAIFRNTHLDWDEAEVCILVAWDECYQWGTFSATIDICKKVAERALYLSRNNKSRKLALETYQKAEQSI